MRAPRILGTIERMDSTRPSAPPGPLVAGLRSAGRSQRFGAPIVAAFLLIELVPVVLLFTSSQPPFPALLTALDAAVVLATLAIHHQRSARRSPPVTATHRLLTGSLLGLAVGLAAGVALYACVPPSPLGFVKLGLPGALIMSAMTSFLQIGVWTLAVYAPASLEEHRSRDHEVSTLRSEASALREKAELARLRGQLEPHFLLNTLNLVSSLVTTQPETARSVIASLGDLLRDALLDRGEHQTLGEEIAWLRRYVEILEVRHGAMLRVVWELDPSANDLLIPRLLLQPLIENAVLHGALRRKGGGTVTISIAWDDAKERRWLRCVITDDGPGPRGPTRPGAVGMTNVRRRLQLAYPEATLRLEALAEGTAAIVELPSAGGPSGAMS